MATMFRGLPRSLQGTRARTVAVSRALGVLLDGAGEALGGAVSVLEEVAEAASRLLGLLGLHAVELLLAVRGLALENAVCLDRTPISVSGKSRGNREPTQSQARWAGQNRRESGNAASEHVTTLDFPSGGAGRGPPDRIGYRPRGPAETD